MIKKTKEKQKAIALRKEGLSYNEILERIPVAKSTLSLWLRDIGLAKRHIQRFTEKRKISQAKAAKACRDKRIRITEEIKSVARKDIKKLNKKELWLIGTVLYWAEGSKQKETNVSQRVSFGNSDSEMIKLFLRWLKEICLVEDKGLLIRLYIHRTGDEKKALDYWSKVVKIPIKKFQKTVFKKHNIRTNRKVDNSQYFGLLDIGVRKSTNLNRKITGWIEGIANKVNNIGE